MSKLKSKLEVSEAKIAFAKIKNDNCICAHDNCNNKLSNPPATGYGGLKICDVCRKNVDRILEGLRIETLKYTENLVFSLEEMMRNASTS